MNDKPLLIGITGGIGSGKSTVAKLFEILGAPVYYADDRGKNLLVEDTQLRENVMSEFGQESYFDDGSLNREFLAKTVFPNPELLEKLNTLVHPAVAKDFENWVLENTHAPYVLKEAALLYETGSYKKLDKTICVLAPKSVRTQRVLLRDIQRSEEQVLQIMEKQVSDGKRRKLADFLIHNDGDKSIITQVMSIHKTLI